MILAKKMAVNLNSLKNLKPVKKGEVRNPHGINCKTPMTGYYTKLAHAKLPENIRKKINDQMGEEVLAKGATWAEANAVRRFIAAVVGKNGTSDSKEIREAIEGKARQRFEVAGIHGEEIKASVEAKLSTNDLLAAIRAIYGPRRTCRQCRKARSCTRIN
jgi:hypothetical protein